MAKNVIYFKGLNGIRAIAAVSVLLSHITLALSNFGLKSNLLGYTDTGETKTLDLAGYGVTIFFVLSGFLITYLLLVEKEQTSTVSIKKFYWRRLLRIWPLYFSYLFLSLCIAIYFDISVNSSSVFYYIIFSANVPFILGTSLPFLSHYWSLAVEEQFYIFWPFFSLFRVKVMLMLSVIIIIILIWTKGFLHIYHPNSLLETIIHVSRFHCILIGAVAAMLYFLKHKLFILLTTSKLSQLLTWMWLIFIALNKFHIASFLDNELVSIFAVLLIMSQICEAPLLSMENRLFNFLGTISFGLYVYHPLLIYLLSKVLIVSNSESVLWTIIVYLLCTLLTIIVAQISFKYLEQPFLKYKKKKYTIVGSARNADRL
ncbi:acyltransferase family protein [Acidiluteibacter ferrifornacis]|uniref:Acyltransferase family protein n=1 Tax=Acidiluteibacter ferrifornacis TaxID=2692424 RepID=A0A6N9NHI9_9FLAO|nr:acyltransferase [Acidiluteibacter ferrifornacis]NBG65373.1 acyltransferase family protein [Acidiluteibacter ferrifornacis]